MNLHEYLTTHYTPKTAQGYEREIAIYTGNCPDAGKAVYKEILQYIGALRTRYKNPSTLNRILCSLKVYYAYLCDSGQREDNPAKSIRLRDQRSRDVQLQDLFMMEELEGLLHRPERYPNLESRNKVLMSLLVYQALYPSEMETLTLPDINLEAGTVRVMATAKTNSRELALKPSQILLFYEYIRQIRPRLLQGASTDRLLIGQRGQPMGAGEITKHVKRTGKGRYPGRQVNAQTIRQSVIAHFLKQGHDLSVVQGFAGHKYPSSTERYRQGEIETLKAALQKYHPFG